MYSNKGSSIGELVGSELKMTKERPKILGFSNTLFEKEKQKGSEDFTLKIYEREIERLESLLRELRAVNPKKLAALIMTLTMV